MSFDDLQKWIQAFPLLKDITELKPVTWINPAKKAMKDIDSLPVHLKDMEAAAALWQRFAPYLSKVFPETRSTNGIIESALTEIPNMKFALNSEPVKIKGRLFLKRDDELPVAGSIKARGGIYEVLHYAEELAISHGLIRKDDSYEKFAEPEVKNFFSQYLIGVGSTGNLGLSIGIISAKMGFKVKVYMSSDAKQWKKDLLRKKGAEVIEIKGDFGAAIEKGRYNTIADPKGYFADDENSKHLFLGYSVAAMRVKQQIEMLDIRVDEKHPLFVYSPCGVGGSPGGVAFGLKQMFGDHVHCFFVEPTHSPAVLIGLLTRKMNKVCVQDFQIDNHTEADGLAVGRPSAFASSISDKLISGIYTLNDDTLFVLLYHLYQTENIFIEPSAASSLAGPQTIKSSGYIDSLQIDPQNITHLCWATGGSFVPQEEREIYFQRGKRLVDHNLKLT